MDNNLIPIKTEILHSNLLLVLDKLSRHGMKDSSAWKEDKEQPWFVHQNTDTVLEVLLLEFPQTQFYISRSSF